MKRLIFSLSLSLSSAGAQQHLDQEKKIERECFIQADCGDYSGGYGFECVGARYGICWPKKHGPNVYPRPRRGEVFLNCFKDKDCGGGFFCSGASAGKCRDLTCGLPMGPSFDKERRQYCMWGMSSKSPCDQSEASKKDGLVERRYCEESDKCWSRWCYDYNWSF
jgi:hypothetical protein